MNKTITHKKLFDSIKLIIEEARKQVVRNVNTAILATYFEIGRMIVEDEQKGKNKAEYAKQIIKLLSEDLTKEYGKGYSVRNLEYFRKFYSIYRLRISQTMFAKFIKESDISQQTENTKALRLNQKTQTPFAFSSQFSLNWSHYIELLKIENEEERNFYEIESVQNNWSVRELHCSINLCPTTAIIS